MDDIKRRKQIEFYIQKLQTLLTKVISESKEMQELKKIMHADDSDMQLCIFSLMMDKESAEMFKGMNMDMLQQLMLDVQAQNMKSYDDPLDDSWTDEDRAFLKNIKIIL